MRKIVFILTILFLLQCAYSEETYDPSADALADIKSAIALAKRLVNTFLLRLAVIGVVGASCTPNSLKRMRISCG